VDAPKTSGSRQITDEFHTGPALEWLSLREIKTWVSGILERAFSGRVTETRTNAPVRMGRTREKRNKCERGRGER